MRFQMPLTVVKQLLERAERSQKREDRLYTAALVPSPFLAKLEIVNPPLHGSENQDHSR